ncbi:MAG: asparagine synthase (glutamine-hydrolyzing) [Ferruginibacter sp.]
MCGIAGFVSLTERLEQHHLKFMADDMAHRGPDADGFYYKRTANCTIGLAHRRLSILDLSTTANQPMMSHDGSIVMVFNGEVFNFQELHKEKLVGIELKTHSDSEVILECFAKYGTACFNWFNGMFAISFWEVETQKLTIVRDRFGVKPVTYFYDNDALIFASELKAFEKLPIPRTLNIPAIQDYFFLDYIPKTQSVFKEINKLPNGHYMEYTPAGGMKISCWYNLSQQYNLEKKPISTADATEQFDELLGSSVKLRMLSDVKVGSFLSGGTDSSLIAAKFQQNSTIPVETFTIGFDVKEYDETHYAKQVAEILKTSHHQFDVDEAYCLSQLEAVVNAYDEPFVGPSTIPTLIVCEKARQLVTVALSGDGGDELFLGYTWYKRYNQLKYIYKYSNSPIRSTAAAVMKKMGQKYDKGSALLESENEKKLLLHLVSQEQGMFSEKQVSELFNSNYQHQTLLPDWENIDAMPINNMEKVSLFDINNFLASNLMYKMDIASMANSLEVRLPFLDYRLVEFSLNLPTHLKINGSVHKFLMKKDLEKYLPEHLIYRKKWGFPAPVSRWLSGNLSYLVDDHLLNKNKIAQQGIFNYSFIENIVNEFRKGNEYMGKKVWSLIVFQLWYKKHFKNG